jgi:hypothetical protein
MAVGGLNDPHMEAEMETEARHPRREQGSPPGFRSRQAWVVLGVGAAGPLAWIACLHVRA